MKEIHILDKGRHSLERVSFDVDKDTVAEIKKVCEIIDDLFERNKDSLIILEASCVKKPKNMATLIEKAKGRFRVKGYQSIGLIYIKPGDGLNPEQLNEINKLNGEIDLFLKKLKEANEKNTELAAKHQELPKYTFSQMKISRKYNFKSLVMNLAEIFKLCFNPYERLWGYPTNPDPSFQRKHVWDTAKKQALVESILNEIPIGAFYINECPYDPECKLGEGFSDLMWDGKQRMFALYDFVCGEFSVNTEHGLLYYQQAPAFFNFKINDCHVNVYMSNFKNLKDIVEAYIFINQGQVKHTDEDLEHAKRFLAEN